MYKKAPGGVYKAEGRGELTPSPKLSDFDF